MGRHRRRHEHQRVEYPPSGQAAAQWARAPLPDAGGPGPPASSKPNKLLRREEGEQVVDAVGRQNACERFTSPSGRPLVSSSRLSTQTQAVAHPHGPGPHAPNTPSGPPEASTTHPHGPRASMVRLGPRLESPALRRLRRRLTVGFSLILGFWVSLIRQVSALCLLLSLKLAQSRDAVCRAAASVLRAGEV